MQIKKILPFLLLSACSLNATDKEMSDHLKILDLNPEKSKFYKGYQWVNGVRYRFKHSALSGFEESNMSTGLVSTTTDSNNSQTVDINYAQKLTTRKNIKNMLRLLGKFKIESFGLTTSFTEKENKVAEQIKQLTGSQKLNTDIVFNAIKLLSNKHKKHDPFLAVLDCYLQVFELLPKLSSSEASQTLDKAIYALAEKGNTVAKKIVYEKINTQLYKDSFAESKLIENFNETQRKEFIQNKFVEFYNQVSKLPDEVYQNLRPKLASDQERSLFDTFRTYNGQGTLLSHPQVMQQFDVYYTTDLKQTVEKMLNVLDMDQHVHLSIIEDLQAWKTFIEGDIAWLEKNFETNNFAAMYVANAFQAKALELHKENKTEEFRTCIDDLIKCKKFRPFRRALARIYAEVEPNNLSVRFPIIKQTLVDHFLMKEATDDTRMLLNDIFKQDKNEYYEFGIEHGRSMILTDRFCDYTNSTKYEFLSGLNQTPELKSFASSIITIALQDDGTGPHLGLASLHKKNRYEMLKELAYQYKNPKAIELLATSLQSKMGESFETTASDGQSYNLTGLPLKDWLNHLVFLQINHRSYDAKKVLLKDNILAQGLRKLSSDAHRKKVDQLFESAHTHIKANDLTSFQTTIDEMFHDFKNPMMRWKIFELASTPSSNVTIKECFITKLKSNLHFPVGQTEEHQILKVIYEKDSSQFSDAGIWYGFQLLNDPVLSNVSDTEKLQFIEKLEQNNNTKAYAQSLKVLALTREVGKGDLGYASQSHEERGTLLINLSLVQKNKDAADLLAACFFNPLGQTFLVSANERKENLFSLNHVSKVTLLNNLIYQCGSQTAKEVYQNMFTIQGFTKELPKVSFAYNTSIANQSPMTTKECELVQFLDFSFSALGVFE